MDENKTKAIMALEQRLDFLHHAINRVEQKLFAMWTVLNTTQHLLDQKKIYTTQEYAEVGQALAAERERLIQERHQQLKEQRPMTPMEPDTLQKKIDLLKP